MREAALFIALQICRLTEAGHAYVLPGEAAFWIRPEYILAISDIPRRRSGIDCSAIYVAEGRIYVVGTVGEIYSQISSPH